MKNMKTLHCIPYYNTLMPAIICIYSVFLHWLHEKKEIHENWLIKAIESHHLWWLDVDLYAWTNEEGWYTDAFICHCHWHQTANEHIQSIQTYKHGLYEIMFLISKPKYKLIECLLIYISPLILRTRTFIVYIRFSCACLYYHYPI